jgi:polysaccharide pyruvyl transferase WcaK-like protein
VNILVYGGGFANKGAEAMLYVTRRELGTRLPSARFLFLGRPDEDRSAEEAGLAPVLRGNRSTADRAYRFGLRAVRKGLRLGQRFVWAGMGASEMLGDVDAVVDISGLAYGDACGWQSAADALWLAGARRGAQVPLVFLPQAWGPFGDARVREGVQQLVRRAAVCLARDAESLSHLRGLGVAGGAIDEAVDIAFLFEADAPEVGRALLEGVHAPEGRKPLVGVVPNMRVYERVPGVGADNSYVQLLTGGIEHLVSSLGCHVVLVPHEIRTDRWGRPDDRFLCRTVAAAVRERGCADADRVCILADQYTAAQLKSVIGRLDLLVGSRFHSLIAALSFGIPVVGIGWSHKYDQLLGQVGMAEYCRRFDSVDTAVLRRVLDAAWVSRDASRAEILSHLPALRRSATRAFDLAAEALRGNHA